MTKYHYTLPILLSLLVSSCVTTGQISIDYLQSAKVIFPLEIKTVGIVNNVIIKNEKSVIEKQDSLNEIARVESVFQGDGKIVSEVLAEDLAAANYFDQVIICDSALRKNDHFPRLQTLSQEEVKQLTSDLGVDMLFSVEDITIKTKEKTEFNNNFFHSTIDAKTSPVIRAYLPSRTKPLISVTPEDEIFWEEYGLSSAESKKKLIKEKELIQEASECAGKLPRKHLLPTWNSADRYYYTSGSLELRDAGVLIREGSWDDALKLLQIANNKKSEKIKMRSAFNIALYYETHDDIDKALEWAEKAYQIALTKEWGNKKRDKNSIESNEIPVKENYSQDFLITTRYLITLTERKNDLPTLELQMKRFNDDF